VLRHGVVVEAGLGPELFVALLALQGILELQGSKGQKMEAQMTFLLAGNPTTPGRGRLLDPSIWHSAAVTQ